VARVAGALDGGQLGETHWRRTGMRVLVWRRGVASADSSVQLGGKSCAFRKERRPLKATRGQENGRGQRGQARTRAGSAAGRRALPACPCLGTWREQRGVLGALARVPTFGGCTA
jgi:hypothetical protein